MACKKTYTLNEVLDFILNVGQIGEGDSNIALLLPPTEKYGEESDKDSDKSDNEVEGDFDHLPRRILSASFLPSVHTNSETGSSRADPLSISEGDREGEDQLEGDDETYDENEEDLLQVHQMENKTNISNTDNRKRKLESNKIFTKKKTRKWTKVKSLPPMDDYIIKDTFPLEVNE